MTITLPRKKGRRAIPEKILNLLWAKAAGRCQYEGCNKILSRNILTERNYNLAYVAHIVAAEPNGPRGNEVRSPLLSQDFNNLMLMCDEDHRLIDKEDVTGHTEARLVAMKQAHEIMIERLTDFQGKGESEILLFGATIGDQRLKVTYADARDTIAATHYPASQYAAELGLSNSGVHDHLDSYWEMERNSLERNFNRKIKDRQEEGSIKHLSVFGLAPQPLLILLGSFLGDIHPTEVYQLHREPKTWQWLNEPDEVEFKVIAPEKTYPAVALNLSLSATISDDRITKVLGEECSIWTFTVDNPHNDFMRNRDQLVRFRQQMRILLDRIKADHGQDNLIHVFPAMPNSTAIELGRVRMPKADLPMLIYDQNFNNPNTGFYKILQID